MITTNSARVAIAQATAHGRERPELTGGGFSGSGGGVGHGLDCGAVLAAMERRGRVIRDWLLVAYAADGYPGLAQSAVRCQAALYAEYTRRRMVRAATGKMFALAGAVIGDYGSRVFGSEPKQIAWYAHRVGFARQNAGTWVQAQRTMLWVLDEWDRGGLAEVGAVLQRDAA